MNSKGLDTADFALGFVIEDLTVILDGFAIGIKDGERTLADEEPDSVSDQVVSVTDNVGDRDAGIADLEVEEIGSAFDSFSVEDDCFGTKRFLVGNLVMDTAGFGDGECNTGIIDFGDGDLDEGNLCPDDGPGSERVEDFDTSAVSVGETLSTLNSFPDKGFCFCFDIFSVVDLEVDLEDLGDGNFDPGVLGFGEGNLDTGIMDFGGKESDTILDDFGEDDFDACFTDFDKVSVGVDFNKRLTDLGNGECSFDFDDFSTNASGTDLTFSGAGDFSSRLTASCICCFGTGTTYFVGNASKVMQFGTGGSGPSVRSFRCSGFGSSLGEFDTGEFGTGMAKSGGDDLKECDTDGFGTDMTGSGGGDFVSNLQESDTGGFGTDIVILSRGGGCGSRLADFGCGDIKTGAIKPRGGDFD